MPGAEQSRLSLFLRTLFLWLPLRHYPRSPSASTSLNFLPIERLRGGGARQSNAELVSSACMQIHCLPFLAILSADTKNCPFILKKVNSYVQ